MIRSMTGFGDASATREGVHYFIEVRSLNNKYFKANIRLPESLQTLEPVLETELRRRLSRGTVTAVVKASDTTASAAQTINTEALERYIANMRQTPSVADGSVNLDTASLLALPGVLVPPADDQRQLSELRDLFVTLANQACESLVAMRVREGAMLADELMSHHDRIAAELETVRELAPSAAREFEERLKERIEQMLREAGIAVEPVDLIREIAIYAEKSDITEEIARLTAHLTQFRELIANERGESVGRTLDFLSQEMLREANTIASKSSNASISRSTVEIKGAIDRIKEQVQNVE